MSDDSARPDDDYVDSLVSQTGDVGQADEPPKTELDKVLIDGAGVMHSHPSDGLAGFPHPAQ